VSANAPEYLFLDESGDPGTAPGNNPIYLLAGLHVTKAGLDALRVHLACFRYQHQVSKEFKSWGSLLKDQPTTQLKAFVETLATLTADGLVQGTVNWLHKPSYLANQGPYLGRGQSQEFRSFQLRLLLTRHRARGYWSDNLDVVLDRWNMTEERYLNLRQYVKAKIWDLEPRPAHVTVADSDYVEGLQIADMYARFARRVVEGDGSAWHADLVGRLMSLEQVKGGLFSPE
jgi:hypothetical protein